MRKIDWYILKKSITGEITDNEKLMLQEWLDESEENKSYYQKMQVFFAREEKKDIDVEKNFSMFERKTYRKRSLPLFRVFQYAAVFLVLLGSVVLWWRMESDVAGKGEVQTTLSSGQGKAVLYTGEGKEIVLEARKQRKITITDSLQVYQDSNVLNYVMLGNSAQKVVAMHEMRVPRGGEFTMKLSDGTMVYLNSETDLKFPAQFHGKERRVMLSGEAYFDVERSDKPFIVEVNGCEVRVLGTRFNVHAYRGEHIETTLEQGSVEVKTDEDVVLLQPGEQAVVTGEGKLSKQKVDVGRYTAWKDGLFVFDNERLEEVMNMLIRWYDIQVFYRNPEIKDVRINGNISRYRDFSVVLEKIEKLEIAHFDIKGNVITVISK